MHETDAQGQEFYQGLRLSPPHESDVIAGYRKILSDVLRLETATHSGTGKINGW
jgi:hypothetical protein